MFGSSIKDREIHFKSRYFEIFSDTHLFKEDKKVDFHLEQRKRETRMESGGCNSSMEKKKNQFFKLLVGDFDNRLRIPDAFLKHLPEKLYEKATIEDPIGTCWDVKIDMNYDGIFFYDGWEIFFSEHKLKYADFLLFTHESNMNFKVQIFGDSACEREYTHTAPVQGKKKRGRPPKRLEMGLENLSVQPASSTMKRSFFKPMFGDFKERLRIPLAFMKHLPEGSPEKAIVEGPSGNCWHIKVNRTINGVLFEEGWDRVSRDHSLDTGEFVVFNYDGNWKFRASFFGRNACEREDCYSVRCSEDATTDQGKKRGRGRPPKGDKKKPVNLGEELPHDSNSKQPGAQGVDKAAVIYHGTKVKEAAESFISPFPNFVTHMKGFNLRKPCRLSLPVDFVRACLLQSVTKLTLRNAEGNLWKVNVNDNHGSRMICSGWSDFSAQNHLEEGDYCVFELVEKLVMHVHIFRVSDLAR